MPQLVPYDKLGSMNIETNAVKSQDELVEPVKPLPWTSRLSSMPYLKGGGDQQIKRLRELLVAVREKDGWLTSDITDSDGESVLLRRALRQFSSTGFIQPVGRDQVELTDEAVAWLENGNDTGLLALLHRHIRYVGEMLNVLAEEGPSSSRHLNDIAATKYDLGWNTLDQTHRRLAWLQCLGAVEYQTSKLLRITERGQELLEPLILGGPAQPSAPFASKVELSEPPAAIAKLLDGLSPEAVTKRNPTLGYIPRGGGGTTIVDALHALVNASSPSITKSDLLKFAQERFGVKESSFNSAMTTLTKSKLIREVSLNVYEPTEEAEAWLETANPLDLALSVHANFLFTLEIIPLLDEYDKAPDLARVATEYFGMPRTDASGVRTRLSILKTAGLIIERANWRYQATPLGEAVVREYPLQDARDDFDLHKTTAVAVDETELWDPLAEAKQLGRELVEAGTNANNPTVLEQTAARAFKFLGFQAEHQGGSGKTDITLTLENEASETVYINVETKSAGSGSVNENTVSFDTLTEHKAQTKADHVVLLGPDFSTGRVEARAKQNDVTLITTAELAQHLREHAKTPLSPYMYIGLVSGRENDLQELKLTRGSRERRVNLLQQIVTMLAKEARDPDEVTNGALTSDQIYLIARQEDTDARPQPKDIEAVLELLQHPLIDSLKRLKTNRGQHAYYLTDAPDLVREKLNTLAQSLAGLEEEE